MADIILKANNITKKYGDSYALNSINLSIESGELYGLIGENGAGKTTLMNIISGLVYPTSGSISLFGSDGDELLSKARKSMGVLIEMPALYPNMNAMDNLIFYSRIFGIKSEKSAITNTLNMVSLHDTGKKNVGEFSLGMKQRLGLAVALLSNPKLLILDEPINGLDPSGIIDIRNILGRLVKEQGVTILISSHILSELQVLATKIGFVHKGKLVKEIKTEELLKSAEESICIKTDSPENTLQILQEYLQLAQIKLNENSGEIEILKRDIEVQEIMEILIRNQIHLKGVSLSTPNLEHYYMKLIDHSMDVG